ncbi:aminobenzoate oxygenase [Mycobacterium sp. 852013-51886_SCH5428379]|uniref:AurF N-oxygenase family protein n=1 Tax=Mycobacterium sp. 852013-51886_SCH5428379 TaxID=1834111 RepID=UPI0007FE8E05|nr:diiron oxygenase [Mycobacterium sp. 852013-51886_SCH5428379]OBB57519.1 aminobenzoate oxygenase [Mycobacterium sp. 852013-51886_SCH5428379]
MTAVDDVGGSPADSYFDRVEALSRATTRLRFDPYVDIDWDAPENALDRNDPRWQLDPETNPLAATEWYAEQPLQRRIDMGRWVTANTLKTTIQFEMMLIRGVIHYSGKLANGSPVFRYLLHELIDECNHIQMFQEFVNRTGEDVPGMRRGSRIFGPILGFLGGYVSILHFIAILCGEQPLHYQQTLQHRGAANVPPLLNKITYIHLAEEARHITFADDHLAEEMRKAGWFKRFSCAIGFPILLRWLVGESVGAPRAFAREFGVPRAVFKSAYWRSAESRRMMAESAADCRRVAEDLGLRTGWTRWIWRLLGIDGRLPRYRGEPDRSAAVTRVAGLSMVRWGRIAATLAVAGVALVVAPDGPRIIAAAAIGAGLWALYHVVRERIGGIVGNQGFEWARFFVWVAVCVAMIPIGGLIGLALVVLMILSLADFLPTM